MVDHLGEEPERPRRGLSPPEEPTPPGGAGRPGAADPSVAIREVEGAAPAEPDTGGDAPGTEPGAGTESPSRPESGSPDIPPPTIVPNVNSG